MISVNIQLSGGEVKKNQPKSKKIPETSELEENTFTVLSAHLGEMQLPARTSGADD